MIVVYVGRETKDVTDMVYDKEGDLLKELAYYSLISKKGPSALVGLSYKQDLDNKLETEMLNITSIKRIKLTSLTGQLLEAYMDSLGKSLADIPLSVVSSEAVTYIDGKAYDKQGFKEFCNSKGYEVNFEG